MDSRPSGGRCKQESRVSDCPRCGGPGCRNGTRIVKSQVQLDGHGQLVRIQEITRVRLRCSLCCKSWTVYEVGGYPHRTYTLAVEAAAVAERAGNPKATLSSLARLYRCDRRTVGRWLRQIRAIADPEDLAQTCTRLDPSGLPAPHPCAGPGGPALAGLLLLLLDHLAGLLRKRSVLLESGPGLASILRWQFDLFRTVAYLTRASPPLHIEWLLARA